MLRRPRRLTRTVTLLPYTTLFRSLHMGAQWTQSSPGFSGKVQPPVDRAAEPACGYFPRQCVGRGKSLVGRIPTQHFPGKSVAAERGDDIIGGFIAPVRQIGRAHV